MNKITKSLLATTLMAALPLSGAMACTIGAWSGASATAPVANSPTGSAVNVRYSGICALGAGPGQYVTDNTPGAEGIYRARFYVLTSAVTGGSATIFKATPSDDGVGSPVVQVDLGVGGTSINFLQNGAAAGTISGLTAGRWYGVELVYKTGTGGSGQFQGWVYGNNGAPQTTNAQSITASATIASAQLGFISGAGPAMRFEAFESTRSADTRIPRLCKGDANNSWAIAGGSGAPNTGLTVSDAVLIRNEAAVSSISNHAPGQPDVNESGSITVTDAVTVRNLVATGQGIAACQQ